MLVPAAYCGSALTQLLFAGRFLVNCLSSYNTDRPLMLGLVLNGIVIDSYNTTSRVYLLFHGVAKERLLPIGSTVAAAFVCSRAV